MLDPSLAPKPVTVTSPPGADDWDLLCSTDRFVLPSQSLTWVRTIAKTSGFRDVSRLYEFSDGVSAILPLFARNGVPGWLSVWRSPPAAWGFGGLVANRPVGTGHVRAVLNDCAQLPCAAVTIRPNPLHADIWAEAAESAGWSAVPRRAHVLDLKGGFDEVWNTRFPGKTRSKIRRAEKAGLVVESGTGQQFIDDFDGLLRRSIRRWARRQNEFLWLANLRGRLRDPKSKFSSISGHAGDMLRFWVAKLDGAPVAAIMVLMDRNAHYTRGAIDEDLIGKTYASHFLQKHAIEAACRNGCDHYHMGETGDSQSLAQFKSSFGAASVPYAEYRYERIPVLSADQKLRGIVKRAIGFRDD